MRKEVIPFERVAHAIHLLRGQKVMLDSDLGYLYGVTTGNLNKAVRRNVDRFPEDFVFQLTAEETQDLIFQSGISKARAVAGIGLTPSPSKGSRCCPAS